MARPGQRQAIGAASAVNAKGGFWFCTYQGGMTAELFVEVKDYVQSTQGRLSLHFLPGYAPELNPDELV